MNMRLRETFEPPNDIPEFDLTVTVLVQLIRGAYLVETLSITLLSAGRWIMAAALKSTSSGIFSTRKLPIHLFRSTSESLQRSSHIPSSDLGSPMAEIIAWNCRYFKILKSVRLVITMPALTLLQPHTAV
jgi:hypothetical protein